MTCVGLISLHQISSNTASANAGAADELPHSFLIVLVICGSYDPLGVLLDTMIILENLMTPFTGMRWPIAHEKFSIAFHACQSRWHDYGPRQSPHLPNGLLDSIFF